VNYFDLTNVDSTTEISYRSLKA